MVSLASAIYRHTFEFSFLLTLHITNNIGSKLVNTWLNDQSKPKHMTKLSLISRSLHIALILIPVR